MQLNELLHTFARHPQVGALAKVVCDGKPALTHLQGLQASAAAVAFAALSERKQKAERPFLIILNDEEEAGYFYHDLTQMLGDEMALFYPSTYRRAVKYAQRDAANEILRTEVLNRLSAQHNKAGMLFVVTFPAALSERVAPLKDMAENTLHLQTGSEYDLTELTKRLAAIGFARKDYVYEPGEFAVRGSILDVYSYASEYPFRIDFLATRWTAYAPLKCRRSCRRTKRKK